MNLKSLKWIGLAAALVFLTLASGRVGEIASPGLNLEGQKIRVNVSPLYLQEQSELLTLAVQAAFDPAFILPDIEPFVVMESICGGLFPARCSRVEVCFNALFGYPIIPLRMRKAGGRGIWMNTIALFDTGADVTVLPETFANLLSIDLKSGREHKACGVGGRCIIIYEHEIEVDIREPGELPGGVTFSMVEIKPWTMKVYFAENDDALGGLPLLGREGFLGTHILSISSNIVCIVTWLGEGF